MAWLSGWEKRIAITVDQTKIDSDLTHFPIPIFLGTSVGLNTKDVSDIFDTLGANSKKIAVTKDDGTTQIYAEIDKWDNVNEKAVLWVSKSDLVVSGTVDTVLYLYYDNTKADNTTYVGVVGSRTEVWSSAHKCTLHLSEQGNGTVGEFKDSTSNANNAQGYTAPTRLTDGKVGYSQDLATANNIRIPDHSSLELGSGDFVISFKVRFDTVSGNFGLLVRYTSGSSYFYIALESGNLRFRDYGGSVDFSRSPSFSTGIWYDVEYVRIGSNWYLYVNNIQVGATYSSSASLLDRAVYWNWGGETSLYDGFDGRLDEIRHIVGSSLSSAWRKARMNGDDDTLLSFGDVETSLQILNWNESTSITDVWDIQTNPEQVAFSETTELDDDWVIQTNPEQVGISETITLDELWNILIYERTNYIFKIISYNPLIYVTNSTPAKIVEVDVTDPANPVKTAYQIVGCNYAKDVLLNDSNDYFYIVCDDGKVIKIEKTDLNNQTIIDTIETDNLKLIDSIESYFQTFVATDNATGELIMIDERTIESINTDLRFLEEKTTIIDVWLNTILGKLVNTDLRFMATTSVIVNTDLRWLKYSYITTSQYPINQTTDWQVKINDVDMTALNDVDMKSIKITHMADNDSIANFILHRQHDKLNYTNTGVSSQITNNNTVKIYIKSNLEFNGKISNISVNSESETVSVTAIMSQPATRKKNIVLPLPSVNETINLYHCFADNIVIDNPPLLTTGAVVTNTEGQYWNGTKWVGRISEAQIFATHELAENYISNEWLSDRSTRSTKDHEYTSADIFPTNASDKVQYYKGIQINLGTLIEEKIVRYAYVVTYEPLATQAENGTLETEQNWNYFWMCAFENFITKEKQGDLKYIGTSLGSLSSDTYKLTNLNYKRQKTYDDIETDLGWYYIGLPPYNIISSKNGKKLCRDTWEDRDDGLYEVRNEGYNYVDFAKRVAELEYDKLKNTNGDIIPVTSGDIEISIDGYYFYGIKLLAKVNIDNTTTANIYKNNNGFPLEVKSITIDSASMKVNCQCDNRLSTEELNAIDDLYPEDEDYIIEGKDALQFRKFDVDKWGYIL